ncbi:MAG: hypothetical protein A3H28_10030 [Acidobacteria bacterium RIFCSPLOWO2_02_FULL_61_28]|nr:MAG: hypothetical protein A3H28_10030 [Acidobacteria bacterium RIFCSPLOWO2_02_FULL_61_28]
MSIGILITVHDGIVLAADSASTLTLMGPLPNQQDPVAIKARPVAVNVYNNANKIANLYKGKPIGCVAYGSGSIGSASISTLLKDFRKRLTHGEETGFDIHNCTMEDVAKRLAGFLMSHVKKLEANEPKPSLGMMIGGYSSGESLGEGWLLTIENGVDKEPQLLRQKGDVGINWGGEGESISRLVLGLSPALPQVLGSVIKPPPSPTDLEQLANLLRNNLQAPLVFAPMPIQDAIDLAEWLVHTAIMFSRFFPGPPSVGGPTESAAITKHEGFKWIRRKHYYNNKFNPEVSDGDSARRNELGGPPAASD